MKMYVVVDDCISSKACAYEKIFENKEKAVAYARAEWESLSNHDKELRDAYFVAEAEVQPQYGINYESIEIIDSRK